MNSNDSGTPPYNQSPHSRYRSPVKTNGLSALEGNPFGA